MSPTRYLDLLLGATCLLLGALLVQALRREDPSPVGPAVPPPKTTPLQAVAQPTAEAATRVFFSLEHYQEIPERPLFARNRRPPSQPRLRHHLPGKDPHPQGPFPWYWWVSHVREKRGSPCCDAEGTDASNGYPGEAAWTAGKWNASWMKAWPCETARAANN